MGYLGTDFMHILHGYLTVIGAIMWTALLVKLLSLTHWGREKIGFADDIFKCIFLNENVWISIQISLKFVSKGQINNITALV